MSMSIKFQKMYMVVGKLLDNKEMRRTDKTLNISVVRVRDPSSMGYLGSLQWTLSTVGVYTSPNDTPCRYNTIIYLQFTYFILLLLYFKREDTVRIQIFQNRDVTNLTFPEF